MVQIISEENVQDVCKVKPTTGNADMFDGCNNVYVGVEMKKELECKVSIITSPSVPDRILSIEVTKGQNRNGIWEEKLEVGEDEDGNRKDVELIIAKKDKYGCGFDSMCNTTAWKMDFLIIMAMPPPRVGRSIRQTEQLRILKKLRGSRKVSGIQAISTLWAQRKWGIHLSCYEWNKRFKIVEKLTRLGIEDGRNDFEKDQKFIYGRVASFKFLRDIPDDEQDTGKIKGFKYICQISKRAAARNGKGQLH